MRHFWLITAHLDVVSSYPTSPQRLMENHLSSFPKFQEKRIITDRKSQERKMLKIEIEHL